MGKIEGVLHNLSCFCIIIFELHIEKDTKDGNP